MRRKQTLRALSALAGLAALGLLSACRPDIPLIPFIKSDRAPYGTLTELTPPDRSPQALPTRPRTAP